MHDYRNLLKDIVELFYHSPFKIFNVNSIDKETLEKPFGYFISLGITTSLEQLRTIRDFISRSDYGFCARLVELESVKSEHYGDFLNALVDKNEDDIEKYVSVPPDDLEVLDREGAEELVKNMSDLISSGEYTCACTLTKIQNVMKKIENWDEYGLQIKNGIPGVFHKKINYKKEGESEFRIGIYVTKV